jgi:hypothetical protein
LALGAAAAGCEVGKIGDVESNGGLNEKGKPLTCSSIKNMRTKIVTILVFCWGSAALCLPVFAILSFGLGYNGYSGGACSQKWVDWLNLWHSEPPIRFSGMRDLCAARVLGALTWLTGASAVPIFLVPLVMRLRTGVSAILNDVASEQKRPGIVGNWRAKNYAITTLCIACSCYYVYWGYVAPGPIYLRSAAGAAVIVLGISFGPALIILLSSGLAINALSSISSPKQGAAHE